MSTCAWFAVGYAVAVVIFVLYCLRLLETAPFDESIDDR